ncbi:MAG: hypothetical protein OJF49_000549 [Ktedonobacterales bacterium]|nr:MAG: hypothetical protein OJF49_000549 [Ktedonobacterales bacterium]
MRTVSKGSDPGKALRCLAQALRNPYSTLAEMNQAMNYVDHSDVGPHYLGTARLAGLLDESPTGWLRPTAAGRALLAEGDVATEGLWRALLALPAYQRYLCHSLLETLLTARVKRLPVTNQIEASIYEIFPGFRARAVSLSEILAPNGGFGDRDLLNRVLQTKFLPLEPLSTDALRDWFGQRHRARWTDLTRAAEIATDLAEAAQLPVRLDAEWLDEPLTLHALLLLMAARQRGQGVVVTRGGPSALSLAVEQLRRGGMDIRLERRGGVTVAALVPAVALTVRDLAPFERMAVAARRSPRAESAEAALALAHERVAMGVDGNARGAIEIEDLAERLAAAATEAAGEFATTAIADEMPLTASSLVIGPPLPLASDLPLLGRAYRFLDEALRVKARAASPGVATLLAASLTAEQGQPDALLAAHPHLALLYLIATDVGSQAELLARRANGWLLDGRPLALALDDRLLALGYEVWDEGYAGNADETRRLGERLVEQGLRVGLLCEGDGGAASLGTRDSRWYYAAYDLLSIIPAGRSAR